MNLFYRTTLCSFALSFAAKLAGDRFLTHRVPVLGAFAGLLPSENPGIAFGIRIPGAFQDVLILIALCLVWVLARRTAKTALAWIGYGMIFGGAIANIADRLHDGLVTDFVQVGTFPIFNVADSCITIGVLLLLLDALREREKIFNF